MNSLQEKKRKNSAVVIISSLLLLLVFSILPLSCRSSEPSEEYKKNSPSAKRISVFISDISPDGKTLLFEYGTPYWSRLGTYDLANGKVHKYESDQVNKNMTRPRYSWDGKRIVFLAGKDITAHQNIYIMDADGRNLRKITNSDQMYYGLPSFSPDGKRIIFARWHLKRKRAFPLEGEMKTAWDLYEMDLATGAERRLTNYKFYKINFSSYMPDGKNFLFSAEGPVNSTGKGPKNFEEYEKLYGNNFIFIMDGINNELKPAIINGSNSAIPFAAADNSIIFVSETTSDNSPKKTKELFLYTKGEITQLTKLGAYIRWGKISRDGSTIVFARYEDQKSYIESLWLMKSDGTELREIKIPVDDLKE